MTTQTTSPQTTQSAGKQIGTLYVGDLHPDVTEGVLFNAFSQLGTVLSIRICRDMVTRKSLGYAYVNYQEPQDAKNAMENMNFEEIQGRPIRIMWSNRDPSIRKSGLGNLFIKNLSKEIETKQLYDTFTSFGNILSCKIALDEHGKSRGHGFIHFESREGAEAAIEGVNGMIIMDKKVYVGFFVPKKERSSGDAAQKFTNCFVKNFGEELDDEKLENLFSKFGEITSAKVMEGADDKSKGFGFVCFKEPDSADNAVKEMLGHNLNGKILYVARAQKKQERLESLRMKFEKQKMERTSTYVQGVNLYVKQLGDEIDDQGLKEIFQKFGTITSAKVMRDSNGRSKNFGFVCFSSPSEATCAISEMNTKIVNSKPLYVTIAQRKEERKSRLTTQYLQRMSQIQGRNVQSVPGQFPVNMQASAAAAAQANPHLHNMFLQQQLGAHRFYMPQRANPAMMTGQNRWSGQFPFAAQQQQAGNQFQARQMNPNPMPVQYNAGPGGLFQPRQMNPGAVPLQYNAMQNVNVNAQLVAQQQQAQQQQAQVQANGIVGQRPSMASVLGQNAQQNQRAPQQTEEAPVNSNDSETMLGKMLVDSDPSKRRQWIGERLFPKVANIDNLMAGRLTGMLLDLDDSELLHMLENDDNLKAKVEEAKIVMNKNERATQKAVVDPAGDAGKQPEANGV